MCDKAERQKFCTVLYTVLCSVHQNNERAKGQLPPYKKCTVTYGTGKGALGFLSFLLDNEQSTLIYEPMCMSYPSKK